ncbi:MAG: ABC transporter permease subunit [Spirochaetaceae bacterium]|jgi:His/Glu/Gln/Arg/opine family amino acid ABC transporter permease subunit|nr:ABC transporter permease subunit [Spirochaetaceae bacterium]
MNWPFIKSAFPQIIAAFPSTLSLALLAGLLGWALGLLLAHLRSEKIPFASKFCTVVVSFFRGVPTVVLLYVSFFSIPVVIATVFPGAEIKRIPSFVYALAALGMNQAAYCSEIFLSSLSAVDKGQLEAAYSVNMTKTQALVKIILP